MNMGKKTTGVVAAVLSVLVTLAGVWGLDEPIAETLAELGDAACESGTGMPVVELLQMANDAAERVTYSAVCRD